MKIQEFFSNIIESMPSALITVDAEPCVKNLNTHTLQVSALDNEAVLGTHLQNIFPMLEEFINEIKAVLVKQTSATLDKVKYAIQGLSNYYEIACCPLKTIEDVIVIQFDDIMQRELLEQRILQTEKMRSMNKLAAGISSEINNPLSASINGIQNIKRHLEPARAANAAAACMADINLDNLRTFLSDREIDFFLDSIEEATLRAGKELEGKDYCGTISLESRTKDEEIVITITDNAMNDEVAQQAFAPYFTTRSTFGAPAWDSPTCTE